MCRVHPTLSATIMFRVRGASRNLPHQLNLNHSRNFCTLNAA